LGLSLLLGFTSYTGLDDYLLYRYARRGFESAVERTAQRNHVVSADRKLKGSDAQNEPPPWGRGLGAGTLAVLTTRIGVDASGQSFSCVIPVRSHTHSGFLHYRAVQAPQHSHRKFTEVGASPGIFRSMENFIAGWSQDVLGRAASLNRVFYNILGGKWHPLVMEVTLYPLKPGDGRGGEQAIFVDFLHY